MSVPAEPPALNVPGDTWTDGTEDPAAHHPVIVGKGEVIEGRQIGHVESMQRWILIGLAGVFVLTFLPLVFIGAFAPGASAFMLELARMIIPAVLGSGATIVGTLFVSEKLGASKTSKTNKTKKTPRRPSL